VTGRSALLRAVVVTAALSLGLGAGEIAARVRGSQPTERRADSGEWAQFDPQLGWINHPGASLNWGNGIASFMPDGSRRTSSDPVANPRPRWLLIGCSYTQGLGLADPDTFGWRLQAMFPRVSLTNFGTGGYGTFQALLRFRIERDRERPAVVIYGFGDFQGARDVASHAFNHNLNLPFLPPRVSLEPPGVDEGRLVEYPIDWFPRFPLESHSGLMHLLADAYYDRYYYAQDNDAQFNRVQRAVLKRMRDEVEAAGAKFIVANLWTMPASRDEWRAFFARERFTVAECVKPDTRFEHPDAETSRRHAQCIADTITSAGVS